MNISTILEQLGLTPKESAVYLAALELGQAPVLAIARKAKVKRPTAYVTLFNLHEKGFVEVIPKGSSTWFQAVDPEKILEQFNKKIGSFKDALPELRSLLNVAPNKPKVRFYEGKKAILALYEDEIFREKDVIAIASMKDIYNFVSQSELFGLVALMKANGCNPRELIDNTSQAREYAKEKKRLKVGETKFLPPEMKFEIDFLVYGHKLAMISLKNLIAVIIEDHTISYAQRQMIEFLWKGIA